MRVKSGRRVESAGYFICLIFISLLQFCGGQNPNLQCYSCLSQAGDFTCLTNPDLVSTGQKIVDCPNGWCTIKRQEETEVPGVVITFLRGCEKTQPLYLDDVVDDAHHVFYFRSCRTLRCNKGDGLTSLGSGGSGGGGSGGSGGSSGLIIVPEESSSCRNTVNLFLMSLVFIVYSLFLN